MLSHRSQAPRCTACNTALITSALDHCPHCGADNRAWRTWMDASRREHLKHFFLSNPWGWLALLSLLLPPVTWGAWGRRLLPLGTIALGGSLLLSLAGLGILFIRRDALWLYELKGWVSPRFRLGLLPLGAMGFLIFMAVAVGLGPGWREGRLEVACLVGLAFTANTLAAGLYALYAYGLWRLAAFPPPVFLDEARLLELVTRAAKPRIQVKRGDAYEAVATQVVELARTKQAGLSLKIRGMWGSDEVWEGHPLKAVQHWRVVSDGWGRVIHLAQEGPLEYVPAPNFGDVPPSPEAGGEVLEGEIICPEKDGLPNPVV